MVGKRTNNKASNKTYNRQQYHSKYITGKKTNKTDPPSVADQALLQAPGQLGCQLLYIYWVHTFQMATAKAIHILGP